MKAIKSFYVFGEQVDVLINGEMSRGASALIVQTSPPGGGPPPHTHRNEDETFTVIEGEYEFFENGGWRGVGVGETVFAPRGRTHTFRNVGASDGKLAVFIAPAGFENFLEQSSALSPATDMPKVIALAESFGLTFDL